MAGLPLKPKIGDGISRWASGHRWVHWSADWRQKTSNSFLPCSAVKSIYVERCQTMFAASAGGLSSCGQVWRHRHTVRTEFFREDFAIWINVIRSEFQLIITNFQSNWALCLTIIFVAPVYDPETAFVQRTR
jgi:hypothetical protein